MAAQRTLGVDLGNSKVKFVSLEATGGGLEARHAAKPLPYTPDLMPDRRVDFEAGLPAAVASFGAEVGASEWDLVVVSTSHFYSFPSFRAALLHTAELAEALWGDRVRILGADGRLYEPGAARQFEGRQVLRFAATKFWGSAFIASKLLADGVSVDVGTTSTDVSAIHGHEVEPGSLADPDEFSLSRLETRRLMWYGMTATPLEYAARHAAAGGRSYHLYPRGATTECLTRVLDLVPESLARQHAYGGRYPDRDTALWELAQAFGLDRDVLTEEDLEDLAANLHRQLIARVAEGIARVVAQAGLGRPSDLQAAVMGLGKDALARQALLACGVHASRILDVEEVLGPERAAVSTAYGAALRGIEEITGKSFELAGAAV